jgi:copper oxidase (laccase) domain-containing protein
VAIQFAGLFPERDDLNERTSVDLVETNLRLLGRNGGGVGQVATSGLCSCCQPDVFHSYRRDRQAAGRMVSTIRIR